MISSIRARVVLFVLGAQFLAVGSAVGLDIWYVHRALWGSLDSELHSRLTAVLAKVGEAEENPNGLTFDGNPADIPTGDLFYIKDASGHRVAGSSSWIADTPSAIKGSDWTFSRNDTRYRGRALLMTPILDLENNQSTPPRVDVFYAVPTTRIERQVATAMRIAIVVGLLSLLMSAGLTWLAVQRGIQPLTEFARQADLIQADGAPFEEMGSDSRAAELAPLARALCSMSARIQAAFQRERQFLSDAAHELKTAVAIQKSSLQLLEQGNITTEEYRDGIARALGDTGRTERLVSDMLLLSSIEHAMRSNNALHDPEIATSLTDSLFAAIDRVTPMALLKFVSIDFTPCSECTIRARLSDLMLLWINLVENAIQHSPAHSRVLVELEGVEQSECRVRITDTGSGISLADLPHIFERFYRSDTSRSRLTGGFGLGLSIAKAIVDKLDGSIRIDSVAHMGTTVEVNLPGIAVRQSASV